MTVDVGKVAIVRFPKDNAGGKVAVAQVQAYRGELALVAKWRGRYGGTRRWARPRWVPVADIAREATLREAAVGTPIHPIPPRMPSPCTCSPTLRETGMYQMTIHAGHCARVGGSGTQK